MVGLEARREFDIGEFRERARVVLPVLAGVGGMVGAVGLYLAVNAGRSSAHGWAVAMSTDTAFALGDPSRVSIVGLTQLVFGVAYDRLVWHRQYSAGTIAGIALVAAPTAWLLASPGKRGLTAPRESAAPPGSGAQASSP